VRRLAVLATAAATLLLSCGETEVRVAGPSVPTGTTGTSEPTGVTVGTGPTGATAPTGPTAQVPCVEAGTLEVAAKANLFAAGIAELPHPAGGGGGVFPVCVVIPSGATTASVSDATGEVTFNATGSPTSGPDGDSSGSYAGGTIEPAGAVSGIVSTARVGFVAGVFLGDTPPSAPPASLSFDDNYDFAELLPALGQVFYIGDGAAADGDLHAFVVPQGATHLYLGIADGFSFAGPPGFYDDNDGAFTVSVRFDFGVD